MSKLLDEKNKSNISKIELLRNRDDYKNIGPKLNYLIDYELIDVFKNILNIPKIDFLSSIMVKVNNYLIMEYNQKSFDEDMLKYLLKHSKEKLEKKYDNHLQNLSSAWENFHALQKSKNKAEEIDNLYLKKNFLYHCTEIFEYAIHNCEKNEKVFGKFIKVIDKSNHKNLLRYVICENCRKSYFIQHFLNYCQKCELNYYSCEMNPDKKELVIATLKNPHCEPVVNEKLHCQLCKNILFLDLKTKQVKCTKCRFLTSPKNLDLKCNICSNQFQSDVIVYNKSEVNYIKKVINYGLLLKKHARPMKLPCCKNIDVKKASFYHKKDCKGIIYFAEFHKKLIIICEKCKAVNNFGKFIWTCPGCSLRFKDMKWKENEAKLRKEIFNKKDIKINIDLSNGEYMDNDVITNNLEINDLENNIERKTRVKNKSNLYDILKKRTLFIGENTDNDEAIEAKTNTYKQQKSNKNNKEVNSEGNNPKNNHNLDTESYSDKQLSDFIKVKKNLEINSTIKKEKNEFNIKIKDESDKKEKDELSTDRKNIKRRYIFEKLIRKQFVSANNIVINNFMTEENQPEKNIHEKIQIKEDNKDTKEQKEKEKKEINSINKKLNFGSEMKSSQSHSDIKRSPLNNRIKKMNDNEFNSQISSINGKRNKYEVLFTEQKSEDKMIKKNKLINFRDILEEQNSSIIKKKDNKNEYIKNRKKENENIKKKQLIISDFPSDQKIDLKKYLFKMPNSNSNNNNISKNKKQENKNIFNIYVSKKQENNKNSNNNNNNKNKHDEKEVKINKKIFDKEYKLNSKLFENSKDNKNQNQLINHCAINNDGLRKIYKDSYNKSSDKNSEIQNGSNIKENKLLSSYNFNSNVNNKNKNNNNINNNSNSNYNYNFNNTFYYINSSKLSDNNAYFSTINNIKNNGNTKNNEEKSKYDNNTFKNRKEKNIKVIKNEPKKEEEKEEDPPDDIVKVNNIDQMETIPLNPEVIKNPLLYNNIQQRIKHLLFRGKLPLFNVDNYTIKKTLGEGTNGIIYQVVNNKTKKNYAMKKIIANSIAELDFYQKEFKICYENPHPYILNIYGVCARCFDSTTYVLYVLMALAKKDLEMEISDRMKTKNYFKEKELISMLKKLVEALCFLQKERNVAHRDVKPENILIFKNGVLKLADFGEAKINNGSKKKTIRGTEFYMSPLLYAGNLESKFDIQHNPFKSDVFSLGYCFIYASCLDYELITEIRKVSEESKLRQMLKKSFPKIYSLRYIDLLLKMIVNDENQRVDFIGLQNLLKYFY